MARSFMRTIFGLSAGLAAMHAAGPLHAGQHGTATGVQPASGTVDAAPSPATARPGLRTVTPALENMNCAACPFIVKRTLEKVAGVRGVTVSYRKNIATVSYDAGQCSVSDLVAATAAIGLPSSVTKGGMP